MAFQKCPICLGTGLHPTTVTVSHLCPTCNGKRIISDITGLPPDFIDNIVSKYNSNNNSIHHGSKIPPGDSHLSLDE